MAKKKSLYEYLLDEGAKKQAVEQNSSSSYQSNNQSTYKEPNRNGSFNDYILNYANQYKSAQTNVTPTSNYDYDNYNKIKTAYDTAKKQWDSTYNNADRSKDYQAYLPYLEKMVLADIQNADSMNKANMYLTNKDALAMTEEQFNGAKKLLSSTPTTQEEKWAKADFEKNPSYEIIKNNTYDEYVKAVKQSYEIYERAKELSDAYELGLYGDGSNTDIINKIFGLNQKESATSSTDEQVKSIYKEESLAKEILDSIKEAEKIRQDTGNDNAFYNSSTWQGYDFVGGKKKDIEQGEKIEKTQQKADEAREDLHTMGYTDKDIEQLVDAYRRGENEKLTNQVYNAVDEIYNDGNFGKIFANAISVGAPLNEDSKVAMAEIVLTGIAQLANPDEEIYLDVNSPYMLGVNVQNYIRNTTRQDIEKTASEMAEQAHNEINSELQEGLTSDVLNYLVDKNTKLQSTAYGSLMSGLDMAVTLPAAGMMNGAIGNEDKVAKALINNATLGSMSRTAGLTTAIDATNRGLTADKAATLGVIADLAERVTEEYSIDALLNTTGTGIKAVLKNMLAEGSEEGASDVINTLADVIIAGDKSELSIKIKSYEQQGLSKAEAQKKAFKEWTEDTAFDILGGALSGGAFGGGAAVTNSYSFSKIGKPIALNPNELNGLFSAAQSLPSNSQSNILLNKINKSKNVSNAMIGELYTQTLTDAQQSLKDSKSVIELKEKYVKLAESSSSLQTALYDVYSEKLAELDGKTERINTSKKTNLTKSQTKLEKAQSNLSAAETDGAVNAATEKESDNESFSSENNNTFSIAATLIGSGEQTILSSVHSTKDGNIQFKTISGDVVSASELSTKDNNTARVVNSVAYMGLGAEGTTQFIKGALANNLNESEFTTYRNYAPIMYELGQVGTSWTRVQQSQGVIINELGYGTAKALYNAGVADQKAVDTAKENNKTKTKKTVQKNGEGKYVNATGDSRLDALNKRFAEKAHINLTYTFGQNENTAGELKPGSAESNIYQGVSNRGDLSTWFHENVGEVIKAYNNKGYKNIQSAILDYLYDKGALQTSKDIIAYRDAWAKARKQNGQSDNVTIQDAKDELTNNCIAALFTSEEGFTQFCEWLEEDNKRTNTEKKTILQQLKEIFESLINMLKEFVNSEKYSESEKAVAKMEIKKAEKLRKNILSALDKAIANLEEGVEVEVGTKNMFAGVNSETRNTSELEKANRMADIGKASSEEIRQTTGWFKGYDGKWRYEISDRDMKFSKNGLNPDIIEFKTLESKMIDGTITAEEIERAKTLSKLVKGVRKPDTLAQVLEHSALFKAYPELKDVNIRFADLPKNEKGNYNYSKNTITLSSKNSQQQNEKTILHEVQHIIQVIEGFAQGASVEYWKQKLDKGDGPFRNAAEIKRKIKEADKIFEELPSEAKRILKTMKQYDEDIKNPELELDVQDKFIEMAQFLLDKPYHDELYKFRALQVSIDKLIDEQKYEWSPEQLYEYTAGEIEARDSAERYWRSDEARNEKRPDIDRDKIVFAEQGTIREFADKSKDIRYSKTGKGKNNEEIKKYSYEYFENKPDMEVTVIDDSVDYDEEKVPRNDIIDNALKSALSEGYKDQKGQTFVYVDDIDTNVMVSKKGLKHSLDRRMNIIAPVTENIGKILKNSIRVNELIPRTISIEKSYVLIGIAKNNNNEPYVVSFVVNRASNEITSIDVLYAVNAKKEATALIEPELSSQSDVSLTASTISIPDLLDYVNKYYPDILPENVLKHYGYDSRPDGNIGNSALYSVNVDTTVNNSSLLKENKKLGEMVEYWKRMARFSTKTDYKRKDVRRIALDIKRETGSRIDTDELTDMLTELYTGMANDKKTEAAVWDIEARAIAESISNNIPQTFSEEKQGIIDNLRRSKISLSEYAQQDVRSMFDGKLRPWINQVNKLFVYSSAENGTPLDMKWSEWSSEYPWLFDSELPATKQPVRLLEIIDWLYSHDNNDLGYDEQDFIDYLSAEINKGGADLVPIETLADKEQKKRIKVEREYKEFKKRTRKAYENAVDVVQRTLEKEKKQAISEREIALRAEFETKYKEKVQKKYDKIEATQSRNKIRKLKERLDRYLLKPSDNNFIPKNLVLAITEVCEMINEADRYYKNKESKYIKGEPKWSDKFYKLAAEYEALKKNTDYSLASEYDEDLKDSIDELRLRLEKRNLADLSASELNAIYTTLNSIYESIRDANKQIIEGEIIDNHQQALKLIEQTRASKGKNKTVFGKYEAYTLNSMRYIARITGYSEDSVLFKLFKALEQGTFKADKFISDASKPFDYLQYDKSNRKNYKKFTNELKDFGIRDKNGNKILITENQAVQLYMTVLRKEGFNHLRYGGALITNVKEQLKGNNKKAREKGNETDLFLIEDYVKIKGQLSDYALKWLKASQYLFDVQSKKAINETSMKTRHREIATAKNYIHLEVLGEQLNKEIEGLKNDNGIEAAGELKQTAKNARQRVVIRGISDVVEHQIQFTAQYYGLAIPIKNFNKIYNGATSDYHDIGIEPTTVKNALFDKWGYNAISVIESTVQDLQTSRTPQIFNHDIGAKAYNAVQSAAVVKALASNISVAMKQAASYPTAGAVLSNKSLLKGFKGFLYSSKFEKNLWEEIDQHTGLHYKRRKGYFDSEIGTLFKNKSRITTLPSAVNPMKWIQMIDVKTTQALWLASKEEIKSNYPKLEVGSSEYWEKVVHQYEDVITQTQPNYDVLHRAEMQKTSKELVKNTIGLFKTQPLQNSGIIYNSFFELSQRSSEYKANKTEENKKATAEAGKRFAKAVTSQSFSAITFVVMTIISRMIMHNMKGFKDDDDEVTAESIIKGGTKELLKYAAGLLLPFGGSELFQFGDSIYSAVNGGYSYDVLSVPSVQMVNEFIDSIIGVYKTADIISEAKYYNENIDWNSLKTPTVKMISRLAEFFGLPASNGVKLVEGLFYNIQDIKNGEFLEFRAGVDITDGEKYQDLYDYLIEGNTAKYDKLYDELIKNGKTKEDIEKGITAALVNNDVRIARAGIAYSVGDMASYINAVEKIKGEKFTEEQVVKAIKKYAASIENAREYKENEEQRKYETELNTLTASGLDIETVKKAIDDYEYEPPEENNSVSQLYNYNELLTALNNGDTSAYNHMYDSILETYQVNGKTEEEAKKEIKSNIQGEYKSSYVDEPDKRSAIKNTLTTTGLFTDEDYNTWVGDSFNAEALANSLEKSNDYQSVQRHISERIQAKRAVGQDDKEIIKNIKRDITSEYKDKYIAGDAKTKAKIRRYMIWTGVYGNEKQTAEWLRRYWE